MKKMCCSSVLLVSLCLLLCLHMSSEVTVKPGDDATLQCRGPAGAEIKLVKWIKPDLKSKHYVFFYRDNRLHEDFLHQSYRGRVELKDPEKKDGDVSVVLKNVTTNDTGRYECFIRNTGSEPKFTGSVNLTVTAGDTEENIGGKEEGDKEGGDKEGGDKDSHVGLALLVVVGVVAVVGGVFGGGVVAVVVVFMLNKKIRKLTNQTSREALTEIV